MENPSEPALSSRIGRRCQVRSSRTGEVLASNVHVCRSFTARLLGLMFRARLPLGEGVLLVLGNTSRLDSSIHMLFVFFPLAVFWLGEDGTVVTRKMARPWRPFYAPARPARYVLELRPETYTHLQEGEQATLHALDSLG
jgi:uncharacterized membrane protein (UPF0127 family)